jgi:predicted amidohydrolase YtcJ
MMPILALFAGLAGAPQADVVISGARIYTVNPARPAARAIAIKDGRILAVGDDVSAFIGPRPRRIDVAGATVLPGLIDSHVHMDGLGDALETLDLRGLRSPEAIGEKVRAAARERAPGEWIRGHAWDQSLFPGREFPNSDALTAAAPDHPVYLTRVDGHAAWVNRKAMELAGISAATPDPPGGKLIRDASGRPTGVLIDNAEELVANKIPPPPPEVVKRRLARAAQECARLGLTTVHDAGVGRAELEAYRALAAEDRLPVRVYAMIGGAGDLWREYLRRGPETGDKLTVRSIKLMADGALGSRGARMESPYSDDPGNSGLLLLDRDRIEQVAREAVAHGFQVNTHAIGDLTNRLTLQAYGAALGGKNDKRFRIEHAQVVALADVALFEKYSVIASMQSTHATSDMRWAEARVGPERVKGAYAWRRFLSAGVLVANGSDFPVELPDPLLGFYAAITRQDTDGNPPGGWFSDQRMTREEALRSWTINGAFAAFEEKQKGSLEPGKLADLIVLSADIMRIDPREIPKTRVRMTMLGGRIVYGQ